MNAKTHYDTHLAAFYSWMVGDFDRARGAMTAFFEAHGIRPQHTGLAIDLGAGTGLQTVALARLGFRVQAVDFNAHLLAELQEHARGLSVNVHEGNLLNFRQHLGDEPPELIVCMGDTLTHLDSVKDLTALLADCRHAIRPGGRLVLSFRPLAQELTDAQRFLPVRSDADRIHTCFLEYFPDKIRVTDLLHEREPNGEWGQKVNSYYKLRLAVEEVVRLLEQTHWQVMSQESQRGMVHLVAQRSS